MTQGQRRRGEDVDWRRRLTLASQDVENDIGGWTPWAIASAQAASTAGSPSVSTSECPVVGVEHHLLRLARIGASEQHSAMTEPDMSDLHDHRHAMQQDNLMAPVELVGFALAPKLSGT